MVATDIRYRYREKSQLPVKREHDDSHPIIEDEQQLTKRNQFSSVVTSSKVR